MNRKTCLLLLALNLLFIMGLSAHLKKAHRAQSMATTSFSTASSLTSGAMYHFKSDYANKYMEGRTSNGLGMMSDWDYSDDEFWTATQTSSGYWTLRNLKYGKYLQITSSGAQMSDTAQELNIYLDSADNYCIKQASGNYFLSYKTSFQGRTACLSQEKWNLWSNTPIDSSVFWFSNKAYPERYIQIESDGSVKGSDSKQSDTYLTLSKLSNGKWAISRNGKYLSISSTGIGYKTSTDSTDTQHQLNSVYDGRYYCIYNPTANKYVGMNKENDNSFGHYEVILRDWCESHETWLVQQS